MRDADILNNTIYSTHVVFSKQMCKETGTVYETANGDNFENL